MVVDSSGKGGSAINFDFLLFHRKEILHGGRMGKTNDESYYWHIRYLLLHIGSGIGYVKTVGISCI